MKFSNLVCVMIMNHLKVNMPWMGNELSNGKECERSRILRDGRALRHDTMLLLKLLLERFILSNLFNLDNILQAVEKK